jgi:hypothetical protein
MPRPKGLPKTGGRKRGSMNKATTEIRQILESRGIDIIAKLTSLGDRMEQEEFTRGASARIWLGLLDKSFPTPKSIEITNNNLFIPIQLTVKDREYLIESGQETESP